MILRVYADTSVIGGCLDERFREPSRQLLERFRRGQALLVLSDLTLLELGEASPAVRDVLASVPEGAREYVRFTREAAELSQAYLAAGVVGSPQRVDAQHIAVATVNRVDVLVSWNLGHIVNLRRIRGFNSVNLRLGYALLEIRTPEEVLGDDLA